jgi:fructose/tagatose bisphosphate aldolase
MDEFTNVEQAAEFVKETGVACLAVLVGNAHGRYKKPPKLDIDRVQAIYEATGKTPLVLHGGSGIPDDQIQLAVKAGIRKMNFATDICYAFQDALKVELESPDKSIALDLFMKRPIKAVKEFCLTKIKLLGAEGKAE